MSGATRNYQRRPQGPIDRRRNGPTRGAGSAGRKQPTWERQRGYTNPASQHWRDHEARTNPSAALTGQSTHSLDQTLAGQPGAASNGIYGGSKNNKPGWFS